MPSATVTGHSIFPSEGDVNGGIAGAGEVPTEANLPKLWQWGTMRQNFISSGFTQSLSSASLDVTIAGGTAVIDGYVIQGTTGTLITLPASSLSYVWLALDFLSSKVVGCHIEHNTTGIRPASSVRIASIRTDGTGVQISHVDTLDLRLAGRVSWGFVEPTLSAIRRPGSEDWSFNIVSNRVRVTFVPAFTIKFPAIIASPHGGSSVFVVPTFVLTQENEKVDFKIFNDNGTEVTSSHPEFSFIAIG